MSDEERERFIYAIGTDTRLPFLVRLVAVSMLLHGGQQDAARLARDIGCTKEQVSTAISILTSHGYGWLRNVSRREVRS